MAVPAPTGPPTSIPDVAPRPAARGWVQGPTPDTVAEHLRSLELMITRRLDGVLHGNYQGLTPGHGSEPGESRQYQPGDDNYTCPKFFHLIMPLYSLFLKFSDAELMQ